MTVGDVFLWRGYPYSATGKIKDRWFIYLGTYSEDPFSEAFLLIPTTTTQLHYYEPGGSRCSHQFVRFRPSDGFGFEAECVADFDDVFYDTPQTQFNSFVERGDITVKGRINRCSVLKQINNAIKKSRDIDRYIKHSVEKNLRLAGC